MMNRAQRPVGLLTFLGWTGPVAAALLSACVDEALSPIQAGDATTASSAGAGGGGAGGQGNAAPAWPPLEDPSTPVAASFHVSVDTKNTALLTREQRQPFAAPVTVTGGTADLTLIALAHKDHRPDILDPGRIWVELYVVNPTALGLRDVVVALSALEGSYRFYDHTGSPFADAQAGEGALRVGRISPEGIGHLSLAVPQSPDGVVSFDLALTAATTRFTAASSAPLALSPDGKELWACSPDGDTVAVIDAATDQRLAQVPVAGKPRSAAVTPDGELVLVVASDRNELSIVDRASRAVRQVLGEKEGIGRDPRHVLVSPDGSRAYVSAYVGDTVTELLRLSGGTYKVERVVSVGRRPLGMSITPDGSVVYVSHFLPRGKLVDNEGWVSVLRARPLELAREARLRDDANDPDGNLCLAERVGIPLAEAHGASGDAVPTQLAGLFLNPAGTEGWIPGMRVPGLPVWEGNYQSIGISGTPAMATGMMFLMDTRDPIEAREMLLPGVADLPDAKDSYLRCIQQRVEFKAARRLPPVNGEQANLAVFVPSAFVGLTDTAPSRFVAFTRGGRRALVPSYYADEIMVQDAVTHHPTSQRYLQLSGSSPSGIAVTPDGKKGYVAYDNEVYVSALDLSAYAGPALPPPSFVPYTFKLFNGSAVFSALTDHTLYRTVTDVPDLPPITETTQIPLLDQDPMEPLMRRGKRLFATANPDKFPQQTASRKAACGLCHPNGGHDGAVWATMEGERRTMSLGGGVAGRGWLHQSATHKDAREFVEVIVKERLGGTGAVAADLDALATYVARGIPKLQAPAVDAALAAQGKALFEANCQHCHEGPTASSGRADPNNPWGGGADTGPALYDVGSATDSAGALIGPGFYFALAPAAVPAFQSASGDRALGPGDPLQALLMFRQRPARKKGELKAPPLVNVYDDVLFFHDGRASSLEEAVEDMTARTQIALSAEEKKALVAYLKTL